MSTLDTIEGASVRTRVGPQTTRIQIGDYERVNEHPFVLADSANLDVNPHQPNNYALARMIMAEEGSSPILNKIMVAECVVNRARSRGRSVYDVITFDIRRELWGWFGEQSGRYCASGGSRDPNEQEATIAIDVMNREISIARGAEKFFAPHIKTQRGKNLKSRARIVTDWAREGFQWIGPVDGIDAGLLHALKFVGRHNASPSASLKFFSERFGDKPEGVV